MIGKPKYKIEEDVSFKLQNQIKNGFIIVVDAYGVFEDNTEVHYDIMVPKENMIYKHVRENLIIES